MENILVAITNFPVLYPIKVCIKSGDYLTASTFLFVGLASFFSHLVENHKHDMPGILGISPETSYLLNRLDVLGVCLVLARVSYLYLSSIFLHLDLLALFLLSSCFNLLSEYSGTVKNRYIVLHSIWHISIFCLSGIFLNRMNNR